MNRLRQRGAALAVAFFILLALLVISVSAARAALDGERAARYERERQLAMQSAEAALADAERDIESAERAHQFAAGSVVAFVEGCGQARSPDAGLCAAPGPGQHPAWQRVDLSGAPSLALGTFTRATIPVGAGSLPALAPRYLIELLPMERAGEDASAPAPNVYRITAIGFGSRAAVRVVLQTVYRRAAP